MTKVKYWMSAMCLCITANAAHAGMDSFTIASSLGTVIAAEDFCGLSYNQAAIEAFVAKRVNESDMDFPATLNLMIGGAKIQQTEMSDSAKTAHCAQIRRSAKKNGFID